MASRTTEAQNPGSSAAGRSLADRVVQELVVQTPIGDLTLAAEAGALIEIRLPAPEAPIRAPRHGGEYGSVRGPATEPATTCGHAGLGADAPPDDSPATHRVLAEAASQLDAYFQRRRQRLDLPLRLAGTAFQVSVWEALLEIPYGETLSYLQVARAIGTGAGPRAVGRAVGQNPLAIVVPCHRVIGSDGSLTGYGGGLPRKRFLLDLEAGAGRLV